MLGQFSEHNQQLRQSFRYTSVKLQILLNCGVFPSLFVQAYCKTYATQ